MEIINFIFFIDKREAILFYDPKTNSNADKQRTVVVIGKNSFGL